MRHIFKPVVTSNEMMFLPGSEHPHTHTHTTGDISGMEMLMTFKASGVLRNVINVSHLKEELVWGLRLLLQSDIFLIHIQKFQYH